MPFTDGACIIHALKQNVLFAKYLFSDGITLLNNDVILHEGIDTKKVSIRGATDENILPQKLSHIKLIGM